MTKYEKAYIYELRYKDEYKYRGCSIMKPNIRLSCHKSAALKGNNRNSPLYQKLREVGPQDWIIEVIEEYPCNSMKELHKREGELIREIIGNPNVLNKNISGRNRKQYYDDNKDKIKQYYVDNKEKYKQYYDDNKEKYKQYYDDNRDKIKQYYVDNKDKIKANRKQRYHNKKFRIF
jgi:hypothetical protein